MRKFQKQQLLDIITSLHILHQESKDRLEKKDYATVQTALSDCQEAAIQMGEAIENIEGIGTEAVACLEKYCDKLYQVNVQLGEISAQKAYKSLESILIKAENEINHMHVRKEVAFFPYKASMWDALESVYLAAKEDETCDVYVVPIPYYDRRADRNLGEMHYEGNEYPKNIEITDYRIYNPEERHPDAIYIHNPYDEFNNVTCVPERYFSRNLRNHTDCLVYIPYFVLGEIEPENQRKIDAMSHFCFVPGVIYAHKVVVQSEKMRQIYINEYIKAAKSMGWPTDRKMLEEKIQGIGSPKFDKVQSTGKDDLEIPKEWLEVIEKADGTWKKIIFYNTSINGLLHSDEKMLEKMKYVFSFFKEKQNEMALLWRPHPLIPSTVKSMRPMLWAEYAKLVEAYRQEGWGIYDDTTDLDRAVILSDAYYGDESSVVQVYQATGKLVMIQCVGVHTACLPFFYDSVIEDNAIYFPMANYNAMCKGNLLDNQMEIIETFPNVAADRRIAYSGMYKYKDYLMFFPNMDDNHDIIIYNISQKKFSKLPCDKNIYTRSCSIFEKNDYIYAVSSMTDTVYKIDLQKCSMECITSPYLADKALITEPVRAGDILFIPLNQKKVMLAFDLGKEEFQYYEYPENISFISTLCYHNEKLWITGEERKIYAWDLKNKAAYECAEFPDSVDKFYSGRDWFRASFVYKDVLWLFPCYANTILRYNTLSGSFEELDISGEEENENTLKKRRFFVGKYGYVKRINKSAFFLSSLTRILYELDLETNNVHKHCFQAGNLYHGQIYPTPNLGIVREENYVDGLEGVLYFMEDLDKKAVIEKSEIIGKKIYDYISVGTAR